MKIALPALIAIVTQSVTRVSVFELGQYIRLVKALRSAGIEERSLAGAIKATAENDDDFYGYEALSDLRVAVPELFPTREWADIQDRFASWAYYRLDDPGSFDDIDEFERFEGLVDDIGVAFDNAVLADARESVEEIVAEREAEAMRDVEREDDHDDWREAARGDDTAEIDSLFGLLDE